MQVVEHRDLQGAVVDRGSNAEAVVVDAGRHVDHLVLGHAHLARDLDQPPRDQDLRPGPLPPPRLRRARHRAVPLYEVQRQSRTLADVRIGPDRARVHDEIGVGVGGGVERPGRVERVGDLGVEPEPGELVEGGHRTDVHEIRAVTAPAERVGQLVTDDVAAERQRDARDDDGDDHVRCTSGSASSRRAKFPVDLVQPAPLRAERLPRTRALVHLEARHRSVDTYELANRRPDARERLVADEHHGVLAWREPPLHVVFELEVVDAAGEERVEARRRAAAAASGLRRWRPR